MTTGSAFDNVVAALDEAGMTVRHNGPDRARSQCPVHGSRGGTVSIRRSDNGAKVHCFAGCDTRDVLAEIGLQLRDLYDQPQEGHHEPPRVLRVRTPWEQAMAELGIHRPPPIEHVLRRMEVEAIKEGRAP